MTSFAPNPEQQRILDLGLDTIRISAGAGTGKTTTVAMVISNLVSEHGLDPEQVLGITFTNKAASELADRVRQYLTGIVDPGREVEVHTYHGFAGQILSEFGLLTGLDRRPEIITPTFSRQLLGEIFFNTEFEHLDITWPGRLDRVKQLGDRLGDHLHEPRELLRSEHPQNDVWASRIEMLETLDRYQQQKQALSVVDYSDLITLSTRLLMNHGDLAAVLRSRYRAVVLDEYQDTNPAQRLLLTSLFGSGFPVIAVGDSDQTIYEWRGASAENFNLFPAHFSRPDGGEPHLMDLVANHRSGQRILDIANTIRGKANADAAELESALGAHGLVETHWSGDAMGEAEWIARRFEELHEEGTPWSEMAVLFRKNKDFPMVIEALSRHGVPFEVANLGGLLSVPEIAEIRSWMSLLANPENSVAAVHILAGSRYRLGLADLAPVSRLLGREKPGDETPLVSFVEGVELISEDSDLRLGAQSAYRHFLGCYRDLLSETQGTSLVETARLILDRTRAWADIEALPEVARLTARLNLYRFLDLAEDWSPLQGRSSLPVFLEYLEAMEEEPAEELDAARLSGEEAVSLVTVHRAKGLEWEVVAIPAVTEGNFPGKSQMYPDPDTKPSVLPVEYRIDTQYDDMPGDPRQRRDYLRDANDNQEWRVAYVAATRAKSHLMVSGAYWYGHPETTVKPKEPSPLFRIVADHPHSIDTGTSEVPERPEILRFGEAGDDPDPTFPDGWQTALRRGTDDEYTTKLARDHGLETAVSEAEDHWAQQLFDLPSGLEPTPPEDVTLVSVTGLVTYAGCPKQFYWTEVDPLPRRRNQAAVAGTEVHRRIEMHQRGALPLDEISEQIYDVPDPDYRPGAFNNFKESRFAATDAWLVEAPFTLTLTEGVKIRGRIDAIYDFDGAWEVVDFKSGRPSKDPARKVQLEAYAVACDEISFGAAHPSSMKVTFAYLGGELAEESSDVDQPWLEAARRHLEELAEGIVAEDFEPAPSIRCTDCDFLRFCAAGQAFVT